MTIWYLSRYDDNYTSKFVTEIFRRQVMQTAVDEDQQFVLDTLWYLQLVQVAKKWRYAVEPPTCSSIQDGLQVVEHEASLSVKTDGIKFISILVFKGVY